MFKSICFVAICSASTLFNVAYSEGMAGSARIHSPYSPNPYANNAGILLVPNDSNNFNQPQTTTVTNGPNGLTTIQSGNTSYSSNGMSSITNGNKTIYSNGVTCTKTNDGKRTCNQSKVGLVVCPKTFSPLMTRLLLIAIGAISVKGFTPIAR